MLYSKAIEHDATIIGILSNRSMVRANMGKFELALEDGDACVALDDKWCKGHYRRAKALSGCERYTESIKAYKVVLEQDPANKDAKKELETAEAKAKVQEKEKEEAAAFSAQQKAAAAPPAESPSKPKAKKVKADTKAESAAAEVETESKSKSSKETDMKGYKVLADGRKTSFFHHEMSQEERDLLGYGADGNLKPKAISAEEAKKMEDEAAAKAGDSSVWAGNTWEDRKMDSWAEQKVTELLSSCAVDLSATAGAAVKVKSIKDWTGTASIYVKKGKKRYLYDLAFKVEYEATGLSEDKTFEGEIAYVDLLPDDVTDGDAVGQHKFVGDTAPSDIAKVIKKCTESGTGDFQKAILKQLQAFNAEFHAL